MCRIVQFVLKQAVRLRVEGSYIVRLEYAVGDDSECAFVWFVNQENKELLDMMDNSP
jgi:hypothetical protein